MWASPRLTALCAALVWGSALGAQGDWRTATSATCEEVYDSCANPAPPTPPCSICDAEMAKCRSACGNRTNTEFLLSNNCTQAVIAFARDQLILCEPKICQLGGSGFLLPLTEWEQTQGRGFRAIMYAIGLLWCFMGVAIVCDVFMGAIEVITSSSKRIEVGGQIYHVRMWSDTIANLSLMALGSSAPEILLSCIEIVQKNLFSGSLGPSTIVGSAAFNLMVISGVCIVAIDSSEVRYIANMHVFAITAFFSVFAYMWLLFILMVTSKNVVTVGEAALTLLFFPVLVVLAYYAEKGIFERCFGSGTKGGQDMARVAPMGSMDGNAHQPGRVRQVTADIGTGPISPETMNEILKEVRNEAPHIGEEEVAKVAMYKATKRRRKSRAYYRVQATRQMTGGASVDVALPDLGPSFGLVDLSKGPPSLSNPLPPQNEDTKAQDPSSELKEGLSEVQLGFEHTAMSVYEDEKKLMVKVERIGSTTGVQKVQYRTVDGTAKAGEDYDAVEGTIEFKDGEAWKFLEIGITEDDHIEDDETFDLVLFNPAPMATILPKLTVTIINVDFPGVFTFEKQHYRVCESEKKVVLTVKRLEGCSGEVTCDYECKDETAVSPADYTSISGTLTFKTSETEKQLEIEIIDDEQYEKDETFQVILTNPTGGAAFPETTDGGKEKELSVVTIISDETQQKLVDRVIVMMNINKDKVKLGSGNWGEQFTQAFYVGGGDENAKPTAMDHVMHFICLPWKVLFALIPPTDFWGGWCCFLCSLCMIAIVTAIIGDMASLFGCVLNCPDAITAITFVALGTSLPDTLASKAAAVQDAHADASIGNVTGSNSVNVFLGLGLPWLLAAVYWTNYSGSNVEWLAKYYTNPDLAPSLEAYVTTGAFVVNSGGLGYSVAVFSSCALVVIALLVVRRILYGGELGGPAGPKWAAFAFLVGMWLFYITLSSINDLKMAGVI